MPLKRRDVQRIKEEESKIYYKVSRFLLRNRETYFSAEEIAKELDIPTPVVQKVLNKLYFKNSGLFSAVYLPKEGVKVVVDEVEVDGQSYYAFISI